jgi:hypothetical protein
VPVRKRGRLRLDARPWAMSPKRWVFARCFRESRRSLAELTVGRPRALQRRPRRASRGRLMQLTPDLCAHLLERHNETLGSGLYGAREQHSIRVVGTSPRTTRLCPSTAPTIAHTSSAPGRPIGIPRRAVNILLRAGLVFRFGASAVLETLALAPLVAITFRATARRAVHILTPLF